MRRHHPPPTVWLMTDARNRADVLDAIAALPRGSGVVFRDVELARQDRRRHFRAVAAACARSRLVLLVAGTPVRGDWRADGRHNSRRTDRSLRSRSVHDAIQARAARLARAGLSFVSPVHPTRSHPGAPTLGRHGFARLARLSPGRAIALGGMDPCRWRRLGALGGHGWAAIDALSVPAKGSRRSRARSPGTASATGASTPPRQNPARDARRCSRRHRRP